MVVAGAGGDGGGLDEARHAYMRYVGQGHEIVVPLPVRPLAAGDGETLAEAFDAEYARLYGRTIPGQEREVLSWTLTVAARKPAPPPSSEGEEGAAAPSAPPRPGGPASGNGPGEGPDSAARAGRRLFDPILADYVDAAVHRREELAPEAALAGARGDRREPDHHRGPGRLPGHRQPVRLPGARARRRRGLTARGARGQGGRGAGRLRRGGGGAHSWPSAQRPMPVRAPAMDTRRGRGAGRPGLAHEEGSE